MKSNAKILYFLMKIFENPWLPPKLIKFQFSLLAREGMYRDKIFFEDLYHQIIQYIRKRAFR